MACNLGSAVGEWNKLDRLCQERNLTIEYNTERLFSGELIIKAYIKGRPQRIIWNERFVDTIPNDDMIYNSLIQIFREEKLDQLGL